MSDNQCTPLHTYHSRFILERVAEVISDIPPRHPRFTKSKGK
jgi:hypothetical protein